MAEVAVILAIVEGTIANVAAEPLKKIRLPFWFKDELRNLEETVTTIKAVVHDAERQQVINNQVNVLLDRLEDVIYDTDNLVDRFFYKKRRDKVLFGKKIGKQVRIFFSGSNQLLFRWKMANKITEIKETLDKIKANKDFHLDDHHEGEGIPTSTIGGRETHSTVIVNRVIGRGVDKEKVIELLLDNNIEDEENVSVVSVVGFGGLGKTTLAQVVFNDDFVKKHFDNKTYWVYVSDVFDLKLLVQKIIKSVTSTSPDQNLDLDQLKNLLRQEIQGNKYLLVLDDIQNEDIAKWDELKQLLNLGAEGSRVLITTRSIRVAQITTHPNKIYTLGVLENDKCWTLFQSLAFEERNYEPTVYPRLVEIGKDIVKKCKGVPLAIKTIGRLLQLRSRTIALQDLEGEWRSFSDFELVENLSDNIMATLRLSYNNLQPHLKHCFAYCSLFPKDHEIDVQQLIKLWIAQGFIIPKSNSRPLEDIGYEYFRILFWRCFFQEAEVDELSTRSIRYCKMHHLMHDLACSVAGSSTNILDKNLSEYTSSTRLDRDARNFKKVRHIYVEFKSDDSCRISTIFNEKKVRTFIIPRSKNLGSSHYSDILSKFKYLRALSLKIERNVETLPNRFGRLKYLRYLDLSENHYIKELPCSITELYYLQTLILCFCSNLVSLPTDIENLISLRHLEIDGCENLTHMPRRIGELTSLQTLDWFVVANNNSSESGGLDELNKLRNLCGGLTIHILGLGELGDAQYLINKVHLESLVLNWRVQETTWNPIEAFERLELHQNIKAVQVQNYPGETIPASWFSPPTNLVQLKLHGCKKCKNLPPLHHLTFLKELTLLDLSALEYVSTDRNIDQDRFFHSLEILRIIGCVRLKGWRSEVPCFPKLSELEISNCPDLTSMPQFPKLQTLTLDWMIIGGTIKIEFRIDHVEVSFPSLLPFSLSELRILTFENVDDSKPELLMRLMDNAALLQSMRIHRKNSPA